MKILMAIGAGSFMGGMLRYLIAEFVQTRYLTNFPIGTLTVNIIGCFIIGIVFGLADKGNVTQEWRLFLVTGLLGGFTTFSAFSIETIGMLRDGQFWSATAYISVSVILGLFVTFIGISIIKLL
jgi:fluoride exporter